MTELLNRNLLNLDPKDPAPFLTLAKETEGCILLTAGDPDFGISDAVKGDVTRSLNLGKTHYADPAGDTRIRVAASDFEKRTKGLTYDADEVITTVGGTEAVFIALLGVLNPGDEVIIPVPAISLYEKVAKMAGAVPVCIDTTEDGYQLSRDKLAAAVTDKTKVVVLNSPNNPTGVIYSQETLQGVHDVVAGKPIFVLCDDVYNRVVYDEVAGCPSFAALFPDLKAQTLVAQSLTNSYAMAAFRMGYLMGEKSVIEKLAVLHHAAVHSVVNFNQDPAIQAFHSDIMGMVWAYDSRRKFMCEKLDSLGLEYAAPEGGFFVFPKIDQFGMDSETFCKRLIQEAKVAVLPGALFGKEGYVRISYSAPMGSLRAGMIRFEEFVNGLK